MKNIKRTDDKNILGYAPINTLLKMFAGPAIISMVANALYNIVDQIYIGNSVGYLGIAATTVAFPIVTIVMALGTLLGVGGSALAAIKLGEEKKKDAEEILNSVLLVGLICSTLMTIVGEIFLTELITAFGATSQTLLYSKQYGGVMIALAPISTIIGILCNMARTDGSPQLAMRALVGGVLANVVLDPIFIFVFQWGVLGAALATAASQIFSALVLTWYFKYRGKMRFDYEDFTNPNKHLVKRAMAIGASSCLVQLSSTVLQILMNNSLLYYGNLSSVGGDVAIGAVGIVMKINMIFISVAIGIGIGAQPIIGFNKGAEHYDRVLDTYKLAAKCATTVTTVGWLCCMLMPHLILRIFGSSSAPGFLDFATDAMRWFLGAVFVAGFQIISTGYFQATGQPFKASVLSMMRQFILLVPLILILPMYFGLYGIVYAGAVADVIAGATIAIFMHREVHKLKALIAAGKSSLAIKPE
jgi:putative MATE family efflux protein